MRILSARNNFLTATLCASVFAALAVSSQAAVVEVDGTVATYTTLSAAVVAAYDIDDGPHVINITTNQLTEADTQQILLNEPITINGDAELGGAGDGTACDIVVNTTLIAADDDAGVAGQAYLEVSAEGAVTINNINVHPSVDGPRVNDDEALAFALRCAKPPAGVGDYTFTNVEFSGGTTGGGFIDLADGADLYAAADFKWPGYRAGDVEQRTRGLILLDSAGGSGTYNTTFNDCKAGLTYGTVFCLNQDSGTHKILGGVYGHCGRDAIHVQGPGVTIQGTLENRVRVLRSTNISAGNSHSIEVFGDADIDLIEYVDIGNFNTANGIAVQGGHVATIRFVRVLGKFSTTTNNHAVYITGATSDVDLIEHCTFHANSTGGLGNIPLAITDTVTHPITIRDTIFTSINNGTSFGTLNIGVTEETALPTIDHSALPTDAVANESLANPPISGAVTPTNSVSASPQYALTLADYDWTDTQGAGKAGNAVGNANVLRPTNPAYNGAASDESRLNGGAGAAAAGIDASEWMLM